MRYAVTENGFVTNIIECTDEYGMSHGYVRSDSANIGDSYNSSTKKFTPPPVGPISEEMLKEAKIKNYVNHIQVSILDARAKEYGYDNIATAVTYADETIVTKFSQEGKAFRKWRSLVWAKCYELLAAMESGQIAEMTIDQIISELPQFAI